MQNKVPTCKAAIRKGASISRMIHLLDSLLLKITSEKETAVLVVPEVFADKIIPLYHSGLFAGHQGVIKTYLKISDKLNQKSPTKKTSKPEENPNYIPFSRQSMDLKVMPRSYKGHKFILCIIDEVTHYLVTVPVHQAKSE